MDHVVKLGLMPSTTHRAGFALVATAYAATMAAGSVPTPLYVLYQRRDHFGTTMISVVFAVYVVGVISGLLFAGAHAERLRRRTVLGAALVVQLAACAVFLASPDLPGILAGRVLSGLSVGLLSGPATAFLIELRRRAAPQGDQRHAEVVATAANLGGLAAGPLLSGVLAIGTGAAAPAVRRHRPRPHAGRVLLAVVPETATPAGGPRPDRSRWPATGASCSSPPASAGSSPSRCSACSPRSARRSCPAPWATRRTRWPGWSPSSGWAPPRSRRSACAGCRPGRR